MIRHAPATHEAAGNYKDALWEGSMKLREKGTDLFITAISGQKIQEKGTDLR
jgi:hypothetical protein